jgi:signal transduction histidine kinase
MPFVWNPWAVPPLASFVLAAAISLLIVSRRAPGPTYAPVAFGAGLWSLGIALLGCCQDRAVASVLQRAAMTAILVGGVFAMRYITWFARSPRRRQLMAVSVALFVFGVALVWFDPLVFRGIRHPPWGGLYPVVGPHAWGYFAIAFGGVFGPGLLAADLWRRSPPSRRRRQAGYIALGYVTALGGGIDMLSASNIDVPPLAWITTAITIVIFYHASVRWRLVDTRTALHRTLVLLLVTSAAFGPTYALALATQGWAGWTQPVARAFVVLLAMAVLVMWIARVEPLVIALFRRRGARQAAVVARFAEESSGTRDPAALLPLVEGALAEIAGLGLVAVVLDVDLGGQRLELRMPATVAAPPPGLELAAPLEPIARGEIDPDDPLGVDAAAAALLDAWHADAVLPLRHQGQVVGVLLGKGGRQNRSFDEVTRESLQQLAARVAVAFINAALEQALERRSQHLEQEVEERTRALALAVEELKSAQAQLVQAERQSSLGVLVAGVSHEINNALNFISGNLPMMEAYADDYADFYARAEGGGGRPRPDALRHAREARAYLPATLAAIDGAAERARGIVGDLRRFARREDDERRALDVREGLESTLHLLTPEWGSRVVVERRLPAELPSVQGWASALNHVFLNVLLNASQAIHGAGRIVVEAAADPAAGELAIAISDSGPGVAPAERERVFQAFYTTRTRAAGLGLAVSRQIVDRHGGTIALSGDPETGGARVTIRLPVVAK